MMSHHLSSGCVLPEEACALEGPAQRTVARVLVVAGIALAAGLAACSDKRDTTATTRKVDDSPIAGANAAYAAPGWKAGDATSWEEHMRTRAQGQNEYAKTAAR